MKLLFIINMLTAITLLAMAKPNPHPVLSLQRYSNNKHYDTTSFWVRFDTAVLSALIKTKRPRITKFLSNVFVLGLKAPNYALLHAAKTNNNDNIELLLEIGANPITALLLAAHEKNHSAAMFILEELEPYCEPFDLCIGTVMQATADRKEDVAKFILTEIAADGDYHILKEALIIMPAIKKAQSEQSFFTQEDAQFLLSLTDYPSIPLSVALDASSKEQNKQAAKFLIELGADTENVILMAIATGRPKIALFLVEELGIDPTISLVKAIKKNYPGIEMIEESLRLLGADLQHEDVLAAKDKAPQKNNPTTIYHSEGHTQFLAGAVSAQIDITINGFTKLLTKMILPLQEAALAQLNTPLSEEDIYKIINKYLDYDHHNEEQQEKMKQQAMAALNAEPDIFEQLVTLHLLVTEKIPTLRIITTQEPDNITLQKAISKCRSLLEEHQDLFDKLTYQKLEDFLLQQPQNQQQVEATLPSEITLSSGNSLPIQPVVRKKSDKDKHRLN